MDERNRDGALPLTRDFNAFIKARLDSDPEFAEALFQEAMQALRKGDDETAKAVLRHYMSCKPMVEAIWRALQEGRLSARRAASLLDMTLDDVIDLCTACGLEAPFDL
jgi:hypothetical protein